MRVHLKRILIFILCCFFTTIVLLAWPSGGLEREWNMDPAISIEAMAPKPFDRHFLATEKEQPGLGAQRSLPGQPPPPSLSIQYMNDPFDFYSQPSKLILSKLSRHLRNVDLDAMASSECSQNMTLSEFWRKTKRKYVSRGDAWERFYADIGTCDLYRDEQVIDNLLHDMNTLPIKNVHIMSGGTQVKLVFTFENDKQAVFKPMRFGRDYESDPNHFYFSDFERHTAEIATFHLDKILGYRRAVPTVGRILNISSELYQKAEKKLKKTFFVSPAKNLCFVSKCDYYCDTTHAICGSPDLKEGSVQVFLPDETAVPRKHNRSPYRRTYSKKNQMAAWQSNMDYCEADVKNQKKYAHGRKLLDLIDIHIMDFLIGNQDRHHYESFAVFEGIPSYAVHLDNGRGFGRTDFDDVDILLPLRQCCVIRPSTLSKLVSFYRSPKSLSKTLHACNFSSMSKDSVKPILAYKHYPAIERRLHIIMETISDCLEERPFHSVVLSSFHNPRIPLPPPNLEQEYRSEEESEADNKKTSPIHKPEVN